MLREQLVDEVLERLLALVLALVLGLLRHEPLPVVSTSVVVDVLERNGHTVALHLDGLENVVDNHVGHVRHGTVDVAKACEDKLVQVLVLNEHVITKSEELVVRDGDGRLDEGLEVVADLLGVVLLEARELESKAVVAVLLGQLNKSLGEALRVLTQWVQLVQLLLGHANGKMTLVHVNHLQSVRRELATKSLEQLPNTLSVEVAIVDEPLNGMRSTIGRELIVCDGEIVTVLALLVEQLGQVVHSLVGGNVVGVVVGVHVCFLFVRMCKEYLGSKNSIFSFFIFFCFFVFFVFLFLIILI